LEFLFCDNFKSSAAKESISPILTKANEDGKNIISSVDYFAKVTYRGVPIYFVIFKYLCEGCKKILRKYLDIFCGVLSSTSKLASVNQPKFAKYLQRE
jgi:hypothetical protein